MWVLKEKILKVLNKFWFFWKFKLISISHYKQLLKYIYIYKHVRVDINENSDQFNNSEKNPMKITDNGIV